MSSRDTILAALRAHRRPFPDAIPRPAEYLPVTRSSEDLVARFRAELERRFGQVHLADSHAGAMETVIGLIQPDTRALAWDDLPLPGLVDALRDRGITLEALRARDEDRVAKLAGAESIRVGITGADAAFANTGTLALVARPGHGRVTSLLPPVHVALLDKRRLLPHLEAWLAQDGGEALRQSPSVVFITGPSSTGDIEQVNVLGAHGPGTVHVVIF
jgi:L-lactate dehydrogenase complex protein LldG